MPIEEGQFTAVTGRLKAALSLTADVQLARMLGITDMAFSQRKRRSVLPRKEIDALIEQSKLNPQWVYEGRGEVYLGDKAMKARMAQLGEARKQADALGLPTQDTQALQELLFYVAIGDRELAAPLARKLVDKPASGPAIDEADLWQTASGGDGAAFDALRTQLALSLGERIRLARGGIARSEAARWLHVREDAIAKIERGEQVPDALQLWQLATMLGRRVQWMLTSEVEAPPGALPSEVLSRGPYAPQPDLDLLKRCVEAVEVGLAQRSMTLAAEHRSRLYWAIYEFSLPLGKLNEAAIGPTLNLISPPT